MLLPAEDGAVAHWNLGRRMLGTAAYLFAPQWQQLSRLLERTTWSVSNLLKAASVLNVHDYPEPYVLSSLLPAACQSMLLCSLPSSYAFGLYLLRSDRMLT